VHIAVTVESDAVMVVGLSAFVNSGPSEAFNAGLVVIDFSLDVGEAMGFLLACE
jgi:hypothetical protein